MYYKSFQSRCLRIISEKSAVTRSFFMDSNKPCYWDLLLSHSRKLQKSLYIRRYRRQKPAPLETQEARTDLTMR